MTPELRTRIDQIRHGIVPEGYHKTAAGIVPTDWKGFRLGEIYTERKEPGNESLPILSVSIHTGVSDGALDEDELGKKVKRIEDKSQYRKALSGDLVFNMMRAWQGAIGVVTSDGMVSPAYIVAMPNDKVYPPFMDDYMKTNRMINTIHSQSYGVTDFRLRLYWDSFAPIYCYLPSVAEQQKIAAILFTQDKLIALKEKRIAEKQKQKKYLMQQLLTGKKRLAGDNGEWKNVTIGSIGTFYGGLSGKTKDDFGAGDKQYITFKNVINNTVIDTNAFERIRVSEDEKQNKASKDDLFFNLSSETPEEVGMCAVLLDSVVDTYLNSFCIGLRLTTNKIDPLFLAYYFNSSVGRKIMFSLAQGVTRINMNKEALSKKNITVPELSEQKRIATVFATADHEIDLLQKNLEQEKKKKKALMQLLLTGIVRV